MNFFYVLILSFCLIGVGIWGLRSEPDPVMVGTSQEGLRYLGGLGCIVLGLCILADHLFLS